MEGFTQIKADVPRALKRRTFAALALREERFNHWIRTQMELWLQQVEDAPREDSNERLARSHTRG